MPKAVTITVGAWVCVAAVGCLGSPESRYALMEPIWPPSTPAEPVLLNLSADAQTPQDAFDPARPTVVIVHGLNLLPGLLRYVYMQDYAAAMAARVGSGANVAVFEYNDQSLVSLDARTNIANTLALGQRLGDGLTERGLTDGESVQMIGHSLGAFVVTTAARQMGGVGQITLLDTWLADVMLLVHEHGLLAAADEVENYWSDAPGGLGGPLTADNVFSYRVDQREFPLPVAATVPFLAHLAIVFWYQDTILNDQSAVGFGRSLAVGSH
jgi:hypothetical protein